MRKISGIYARKNPCFHFQGKFYSSPASSNTWPSTIKKPALRFTGIITLCFYLKIRAGRLRTWTLFFLFPVRLRNISPVHLYQIQLRFSGWWMLISISNILPATAGIWLTKREIICSRLPPGIRLGSQVLISGVLLVLQKGSLESCMTWKKCILIT